MFKQLRRNGITRGLIGGNRTWLAIGGAAWTLHALRWAFGRQEEVVFSDELRQGEQLLILHGTGPAPKRGRRARRRAG
jgi:hypothetical protein